MVSGGRLELALPAGTTDGAEVRTQSTYRYGSYRARIQVADAPSSITGFFLYAPPDYESEIDVELFNDPHGAVMFTTYARGAQTHTERRSLGFDPTAAMHEYRFDYGPGSVSFLVDGVLLRTWTTGVPSAAMNLYLNAWFPAWPAGTAPTERRATLVDSVEFRPR